MIVICNGKKSEINAGEGTLLEILRANGYQIQAPCGGNGTCGKCRVRVQDRGMVTACQYRPEGDEVIFLDGTGEDDMQIVTAGVGPGRIGETADREYRIAVDLGTTTIAMELAGEQSGKIYASYAAVNPQRAYGADVVSRIQAACEGRLQLLAGLAGKAVKEGVRALLASCPEKTQQIRKLVIAGNTTMIHLLLGYSCDGLGTYPFRPVTLEEEDRSYEEVFGSHELDARVIVIPGFSVYVGGDIVSGLLTCITEREERVLFLDLGTNGEMVLWENGNLYIASAAAGPAFEGGNITFGTGSVPGAICGVTLRGRETLCRTIGEKEPSGICGTGLVEAIAELRKNRLIDETGLLVPEYFETGFPLAESPGGTIRLMQKDIREFQMAKAAIGAGLKLLLKRAGLEFAQIDRFLIAGGFGFHLDLVKASLAGMIPPEFTGRDGAAKVTVIGNSALAGAVLYGTGKTREEAENWRQRAEEVVLAQEEEFQALYMEEMYLP